MSRNYNWENKEERANAAQKHTDEMKQKYSKETAYSIQNTTIYNSDHTFPSLSKEVTPKYIVEDLDSVSAVFKHHSNKTAVLNFASFKNPGGKFLNGARAQEECLCHESNLYNILLQFQNNFYTPNLKCLNRSLYQNKALYGKDVLFLHNQQEMKCDVITCAAPNYKAAHRFQRVTQNENFTVLESRIKFIIDIAEEQQVETLILGAFGCGVFGQDPKEVAQLFKKYLDKTKYIHKVIYAIPNSNNSNYAIFKRIFQ